MPFPNHVLANYDLLNTVSTKKKSKPMNPKFRHCLFTLLILLIVSCSDKDPIDSQTQEENTNEKMFKGFVDLRTQADVDDFASNHYDGIIGDIMISSNSINSIDDLVSIKSITGFIYVVGTALIDLDGLSNIKNLSDIRVKIYNNSELKNINGLNKLSGRLISLEISNNPKIENIESIMNVTEVTNEIFIDNNNKLLNLNGLININKYVKFLSVLNNDNLNDISGIHKIPETSDFTLTGNNSVKSFGDSFALAKSKSFRIAYNELLENIDGLSNLENSETLSITNNPNLLNVDGLDKLEEILISINIEHNSSLKDFCGLTLLSTSDIVVFYTDNNAFNPTKEDIKAGNCKI